MTLAVTPGARITVHNNDPVTHTLTGPGFDTGNLGGSKTTTITAPHAPGSYAFMCSIHSYMKGTLIVR